MRHIHTLLCTIAMLASSASAFADDDADPVRVEKSVEIAAARDKNTAERVIAEITSGSIKLSVDPTRDQPHVEAVFSVDGADEKDVKRRSDLVKLYAERASDGTIVVRPMFPGKAMKRDSVEIQIVVPKCGESNLKAISGAITAEGTAGRMKVQTKSGAVRIAQHAGSIDAASGDGALEITDAAAEVRAASTGGAITVSLADANDLPFDIESRGGRVKVEVGAGFDGAVKMHTTSGDIDVSDSARLARVTQSSEHSKAVEVGKAGGGSEVRTTTGSIRLTVRSK
jgi:DUF4097 and DUF4098 domain-containing protein YvlB